MLEKLKKSSSVFPSLRFKNVSNDVFSCFSWKDPNNDFKKTLKLTGVPTLLRYGTVGITLLV